MIDATFWKGKRVFVTGHTGFKGSWLSTWLLEMDAIVRGYSLTTPTVPSLFEQAGLRNEMDSIQGDIRNSKVLAESLKSFRPEVVFHLAAQPLVRYSYVNPIETYETNVMGTVNVLDAVRNTPDVKVFVNVTTDKVYENKEWSWGYRENDRLGGHDPYSNSKACSELVTSSYCNSFFSHRTEVGVATARAGNVIGGGDWASDRLVPDVVRAILSGEPMILRNPGACRPWQHVLEPLSGYLCLAQKLGAEPQKYSGNWNFGPEAKDVQSVQWIVECLHNLTKKAFSYDIQTGMGPHEAGILKLDIEKARQDLRWEPKWSLREALNKVVNFNAESDFGRKNVKAVMIKQISEYENYSV